MTRLRKNLAINLRHIREGKNWKQDYMADFLGYSLKQYNQMENAKANPNLANVEEIAEKLSQDPFSLVAPESGYVFNNISQQGGESKMGIFNAEAVVRVVDSLLEQNKILLEQNKELISLLKIQK
jgi:transcriptional regulator with XRE-family HTH domain